MRNFIWHISPTRVFKRKRRLLKIQFRVLSNLKSLARWSFSIWKNSVNNYFPCESSGWQYEIKQPSYPVSTAMCARLPHVSRSRISAYEVIGYELLHRTFCSGNAIKTHAIHKRQTYTLPPGIRRVLKIDFTNWQTDVTSSAYVNCASYSGHGIGESADDNCWFVAIELFHNRPHSIMFLNATHIAENGFVLRSS